MPNQGDELAFGDGEMDVTQGGEVAFGGFESLGYASDVDVFVHEDIQIKKFKERTRKAQKLRERRKRSHSRKSNLLSKFGVVEQFILLNFFATFA
jgi:hypothetical protein